MKSLKLLAVTILLNISVCLAQDNTPVTKAVFDTAIKKTTDKINSIETSTKNLKDSLDKKPPQDSSIFKNWEAAKNNPCPLYNGKCGTCTVDPKLCTDNPVVIKFITWILLIIILFMSFRYFFYSALCRDESYINGVGGLSLRPVKDRPYSYARTQLFWWSLIIFNCYGIFFALYGTLLPLNPTCIILLGGGLATQLLGKTIDKSQLENTAKGDGNNPIAIPIRHQDTNSKGVLTDILLDDNGISIHRLQSVMYNILYGIGFISYFIKSVGCCQYPLIDFESWQLTLLGVSIAGYLGMKTTENPKATEPARKQEAVKNEGEEGNTEEQISTKDQAKYQ